MEIEEKSPVAVPKERETLNNEGGNEDLDAEEAWNSSVKDSQWATVEPIADYNRYPKSNRSSSQSKWAAHEGNHYRPPYSENNFGGYGYMDRNRREHSNYARPYYNRQGYAGSRDSSTEQYRPGNGDSIHSYGTRNFNNMDSNRFTDTASMRFDSYTNQIYHNRPYNNTFRESDNSSRYNNRYDNRSSAPRTYENTSYNRNDQHFGHQNYQHERNDRQYNRQNYQNDRNSHYTGRQSHDSAIDRWHSSNLVEGDTDSSAQDHPWNMRSVTGNHGNKNLSDEENEQNNVHEEENFEEKTGSDIFSGNPESIQEPENFKENDENALYNSHNASVIQSDTVNIQPATSSQGSTATHAGQTVNEYSSVESMDQPPNASLHGSSNSDISQVDEDGTKSTESVPADSTLPSHSTPKEQAVNDGKSVDDSKQGMNAEANKVEISSDSIHAQPEPRQQSPTERKSSGASASLGKTSIVDRLAAGGYHKPTVDEDALNAKIERIRLQNEKLERKQKLIEEEEMEIARQLKLENEKREQERLENDRLDREHRLAEEKKQREKREKEQRMLDQIKAEREANASRKAEAMTGRDWDMSKEENDDGYRDRHSRSKFSNNLGSNNLGQRWPSPPARSRNDHTFDHSPGHHSQGRHRYGVENTRQEPVKKQFSVTEEDWPDLGNSQGELGRVERKPAIWVARSALAANEKEHSRDTDTSSTSPPSNSQSTGDSRKLVPWSSKKAQDPTETTSPKQDESDAKPVPKLNWEDLIAKATPVKDWASDSPTNDDMDFGSSPFG